MVKRSNSLHTVLIVDDHPIVRHGLCRLISQEKGLSVCGEAGTIKATMEIIEREKPDLVILDISIGENNGLDMIHNIKTISPDTRILVLSMHDEKFYAERAIRLGASGYLMKHEATDKLMQAVRKIIEQDIYLSEAMSNQLVKQSCVARAGKKQKLTDRQNDILEYIGRGLDSKNIATFLNVSPKTVEAHKSRIKTRLKLKTSSDLKQYAVKWLQTRYS